MKRPARHFYCLAFGLLPFLSTAQQAVPDTVTVSGKKVVADTVSTTNKKANRAALYSAILPGSGQFYNKSYWKIPVLYAGAGTLIYFIVDNNKEYQKYKEAYLFRLDGDSTTNDTHYANLNDEDIKVRMDYYRRNRDFCYVMIGALYVLNIIDAYVDAHLKDFDISDNLSLSTRPVFFMPQPGQPAGGISLCLKLRR